VNCHSGGSVRYCKIGTWDDVHCKWDVEAASDGYYCIKPPECPCLSLLEMIEETRFIWNNLQVEQPEDP
jgi:hypothetical protein